MNKKCCKLIAALLAVVLLLAALPLNAFAAETYIRGIDCNSNRCPVYPFCISFCRYT